MHLTFLLLFTFLVACQAMVVTNPQLTNSERLRRGLPLKRPVLRRGTSTRRDTSPSNIPTTYTGYIQVSDGTSVLGYLWASGYIGPYTASVAKVTFSVPSGNQLEAACSNCGTGKVLGLKSYWESLETNYSYSFAAIGPVLPSSGTAADGSYSNFYESKTWNLDYNTKTISVSWNQADGSVVNNLRSGPVDFNTNMRQLLVVGNDNGYGQTHDGSKAVFLTFIPA
ncbi:hypothetical protein DL96DRAFT_1082605 [Flagelloscypha sp. PMI_526]|nr:hypothetical protein DL96DRAFT_1082605 [Flagelloscypha sp. PMI_526]